MNEHQPAERVATWIDTGTVRVAEFRLARGACGDVHLHSAVAEFCVCLEGELVVSRYGCAPQTLKPGEYVEIPAGVTHRLSGAQECESRYLVIQGVGAYDYVIA